MHRTCVLPVCLLLPTVLATACRDQDCGVWETYDDAPGLRAITFQVAVGLGGALAEATDRGYEPRESGTTEDLLAVSAARENPSAPLVAVGRRGTIVVAEAPGKPWKAYSVEDGLDADLRGVAYTTYPQDFGLAVGNAGTVVIGKFHGTQWLRAHSPTALDLNAVAIDEEGGAVVVGDRGTILSTQDLGNSWKVVVPPTNEDLLSVAIHSVGPGSSEPKYVHSGYIVGTTGTLLHSMDGMSWKKVDTGVNEDLRQVIIHSESNIDTDVPVILGETRLYGWEPNDANLRLKSELHRPIYSVGQYLWNLVVLVEPGEILRFREPYLCTLSRD